MRLWPSDCDTPDGRHGSGSRAGEVQIGGLQCTRAGGLIKAPRLPARRGAADLPERMELTVETMSKRSSGFGSRRWRRLDRHSRSRRTPGRRRRGWASPVSSRSACRAGWRCRRCSRRLACRGRSRRRRLARRTRDRGCRDDLVPCRSSRRVMTGTCLRAAPRTGRSAGVRRLGGNSLQSFVRCYLRRPGNRVGETVTLSRPAPEVVRGKTDLVGTALDGRH